MCVRSRPSSLRARSEWDPGPARQPGRYPDAAFLRVRAADSASAPVAVPLREGPAGSVARCLSRSGSPRSPAAPRHCPGRGAGANQDTQALFCPPLGGGWHRSRRPQLVHLLRRPSSASGCAVTPAALGLQWPGRRHGSTMRVTTPSTSLDSESA